MKDNVLIPIIIQAIMAGETAAGIAGVPVLQSYQPTQQGVNSVPTIYLQKLPGDHRYGSPLREDVWNADNQNFDHIETQQYESTFQISALASQNPETPDQLTASDIINAVAAILQSSDAIDSLQKQDVGIYRITDIRNPFFTDDYGRLEASPSFDLTVTHKQVIAFTSPKASPIEINVYSI